MILLILVVVYSLTQVPIVRTSNCSDLPCIRNVEDLKAKYKCDRLSATGGHNSLLTHYRALSRKSMQAVYYNISTGNTTCANQRESVSVEECCNPSDKDTCKVYMVYSSTIFYNIHPEMLYHLTSIQWKPSEELNILSFNYPQFCWTPSAFCDGDKGEDILLDFTHEVCHIDILLFLLYMFTLKSR